MIDVVFDVVFAGMVIFGAVCFARDVVKGADWGVRRVRAWRAARREQSGR